MKSGEFKTYSELSVTERQMKAACTEQLAHPEQDIIRQVEVLRAVRRRWVREFEFSYPRPEGRTDNWDSE
jgi:hypothetical protein